MILNSQYILKATYKLYKFYAYIVFIHRKVSDILSKMNQVIFFCDLSVAIAVQPSIPKKCDTHKTYIRICTRIADFHL